MGKILGWILGREEISFIFTLHEKNLAVKLHVPLKTPLCLLNMSDFEIIKLASHVYKLLHGRSQ